MQFVDLGLVPFHTALARQETAVEAIAAGQQEETIFLLEHPNVFTSGRRGKPENLLAERDLEGNRIELVRINRGGDLTYHGPGQLVGYPHLDLSRRGRDLHLYLRRLEEVLIRSAAAFDVTAYRVEGRTGVWTEEGKLASIGIGVRKWITMHGFALNVSPDLDYFKLINPCGISSCPVTSLKLLAPRPPTLKEVKPVVESCLREILLPEVVSL